METRDVTFKNLTEEQINAIKVLLNIEEQKEKEEAEFPKYGRKYYFIDGNCEVCQSIWYDDKLDRERLSLGNCFETREEAEFEVERHKVIHEMKKFAEPEDFGWNCNNFHYYIYYDYFYNRISFGDAKYHRDNNIYFKSEEDTRDCIKAVGEDRIKKYYLRVED